MNSPDKLINVSSRQLQAFLEVSRLQSFVKAAERVHLSPSGMSMLVRELEAQVGARLFDRTTRSVKLTDAGRRLLPAAERIIGELHVLGPAIGGAEAAARSRIDLAATPMVSASLLPEVLRAFASRFPHVRVHLSDVDVSIVRSRVIEGQADIGLGFFVRPAAGLVREPLCKFRLMRISPPSGRNTARWPARDLAWSSLEGLPLVSLPQDNPIQALIEKQLTLLGRAHEERPRVNLISTIIGMVRAGHGHAVIPSFALEECLRQNLQVAMLRSPAVHIELYLVSHRGHPLKPAAREFAAMVRQAALGLAGEGARLPPG